MLHLLHIFKNMKKSYTFVVNLDCYAPKQNPNHQSNQNTKPRPISEISATSGKFFALQIAENKKKYFLAHPSVQDITKQNNLLTFCKVIFMSSREFVVAIHMF